MTSPLLATIGLLPLAAANEELKALADFASIVLALLTFFTAFRAGKLAKDRGNLGSLTAGNVGQLVIDGVLALITLAACAAMFSSFTANWSVSQWTERPHALQSMFSIIYVGFGLVLLVQLGLIGGRLCPSLKNSYDTYKAKRGPGAGSLGG
jgi:hypothetical protein